MVQIFQYCCLHNAIVLIVHMCLDTDGIIVSKYMNHDCTSLQTITAQIQWTADNLPPCSTEDRDPCATTKYVEHVSPF